MKISKNSKFVFLILIYSFSLCVFDMLGIVNLTATARDEHEPHDDWHTTDMDTYISEQSNSSNYGNSGDLKIGNSITGQYISYLYFSFSAYDTTGANKIELIIYVTSIIQKMLLEVFVANSEAWNESSINWINAPNYTNSIVQKSVGSTEFVNFDVSSAFMGSQIPQITFVIISDTPSSIIFRSKENDDTRMEDEFPHIIFIRNITIPGFDILITTLLLGTVITLVGIKIKINKKLKVVS